MNGTGAGKFVPYSRIPNNCRRKDGFSHLLATATVITVLVQNHWWMLKRMCGNRLRNRVMCVSRYLPNTYKEITKEEIVTLQ